MTFACLAPRKAVRARIAKSSRKVQGGTIETLIARLLQDFEHGKLTRRQLIQSLTLAAAATSAPGIASAADGKGFKTIGLNHNLLRGCRFQEDPRLLQRSDGDDCGRRKGQ